MQSLTAAFRLDDVDALYRPIMRVLLLGLLVPWIAAHAWKPRSVACVFIGWRHKTSDISNNQDFGAWKD